MLVGALAIVVASPAVEAPARAPEAVAAAACAKETKRLKTFKRGMKAAQRRYFRTHRSRKARKRFVARQRRKLKALTRARKRCLARVTPAPAPAPSPVAGAPPGGGAPPPAPPPAPPSPPARDAIDDVISDRAEFTPGEVTVEDQVEFVRTQLELELAPGATVAGMNALLDRLDAEVVSSLDGVGLLTVRIPDPGSLAALRARVASLAGDPALARADLVTVPVPVELPDTIAPAGAGMVRPQLGSRASGAWNARGALSGSTPTLLIADFFGAGPPGPEVAVSEIAADFATTNPLAHGYTILGLAAATFEPGAVGNLQADQVTGMWAGPDLPLRVIDLRRSIAGSTAADRLLQTVRAISGDVVVNTSFEDGCARAGCTAAQIQQDARQWIRRVRDSGLEGRFLHVSAAGNIYPDLLTDTQAALGAAFNAAVLTPPPGVAPLSNTIVVGNTTSSDPADGPVVPVCLTATSKRGSHISAVGNDIKSFSAPGVFRDLPAGGTSSAAPQVAGAAAAVWALAPALSPEDLVDVLRQTARPVETDASADPRCTSVQAPPALDFYSAVLAADGPITQPARSEILDADGDGTFDEQDLLVFRDEFIAAAGALDYGRYDLNGDGRTGGGRDRIDLDARSPVEFTFSRRREVLGLEVLHDENDARDLDVLCHEAHGPNYGGDTAARDLFAEQFCLPPVEIAADPAFPSTLSPGHSEPLRIVARRSDLLSHPAVSHQPGVHLDFNLVSGTLGAVEGTTGVDGAFTTNASLGPSGGFEVEVIARAGDTGPELDRVTITAARGAGPIQVLEGETFLVANAEADSDVKENEAVDYADSVSAADKDATASASLSSALTQTGGGISFTGSGTAAASDGGGGGDASSYLVRRFVVTEEVVYRLKATLQGGSAEDTFGRVSLGFTGAPAAFFNHTTFGNKEVTSFLGAGDFTLTAEVGCTPPRPDGGSCNGSWSFELEVGDTVGP
jgi:hypothetical protein